MRVLSRSARNLKLHQNTLSFRCLISAFPIAFALHVVDESNCTSVCFSPLTGYNTNGSNIVCHDSDFNSTDVGENFRRCVSCEVQSEALPLSGEQSDLGWALYNMRYALDWCLFGFPGNGDETASDQCSASCASISDALEINVANASASASTTYDYCGDPKFLPNVESCASCYRKVPHRLYLSNFLYTLEYACQKQPSPALPFPVKPSDIFTDDSPSNFSTLGVTSASSSGISHPARAAIAISVPVGVFLIMSFLLVFLYVDKHIPDCPQCSHGNEKHLSKSTSGWTQSLSSPTRKGHHSRNQSGNSHRAYYPAPLRTSKVPKPAPLRTRNSPNPFCKTYDQSDDKKQANRPARRASTSSTPETSYTTEMLPATRYSPPPERSCLRPASHPEGLVSWERIAIQNARIRAIQGDGPSPSPISPLTRAQTVPRSPSSLAISAARTPTIVKTPPLKSPVLRSPDLRELRGEIQESQDRAFRQDTPPPDDGKLERRGSGGGGVMRSGSVRSEKARKEVRWSKKVDYEG